MSPSQVLAFDSEAGFGQALDAVLLAARSRICVFDRDLTRVDLEPPGRIAALAGFLEAGGTLRIAVHDMRRLESRSPRLLSLLRKFLHAVEVRRSPEELRHLHECYLVGENGYGAVRFHIDHARGKLICADAAEIRPWLDRFEQLWTAAEPCAIGTVLGL